MYFDRSGILDWHKLLDRIAANWSNVVTPVIDHHTIQYPAKPMHSLLCTSQKKHMFNFLCVLIGWLEPLLDRIAANWSNVVTPVIDVIETMRRLPRYPPKANALSIVHSPLCISLKKHMFDYCFFMVF